VLIVLVSIVLIVLVSITLVPNAIVVVVRVAETSGQTGRRDECSERCLPTDDVPGDHWYSSLPIVQKGLPQPRSRPARVDAIVSMPSGCAYLRRTSHMTAA